MWKEMFVKIYLGFVVIYLLKHTTGQPTCTTLKYSGMVGINLTEGYIVAELFCSPSSGSIAYYVDTTVSGSRYFEMRGANVTLVNRLDVEYGNLMWEIKVVVNDGSASPVTATVSITTYQSTTTTTSTMAPPGYSWFKEENNKVLFWSVMGFIAIITGTCILLCFRFHRKGICFPKSWPSFEKMKDSFNRQVKCCPLPCDFGVKEKMIEDAEDSPEEEIDDTPFGLPPRKKNKPPTPAKAPTPSSKSVAPSKQQTPAPGPSKTQATTEDEDIDRSMNVTPLVIGNVQLNDVGFDGMRSPGFNAPMFTSYGGKKDRTTRVTTKRY